MKKNVLLSLMILLLAVVLTAAGEDVTVESRGLALSSGEVSYPVLLPEEDPVLAKANEQLLLDGGIRERLNRLTMLLSGGEIRVTWEGNRMEDVYSCVFSAEGMVKTNRRTHVWNAANIDLRTGEEIPFAALFRDEEEARSRIEEILEAFIAPELSAHLQNSELTPIPDTFALTRSGLRLLYPVESLSTLSDRAGDVFLGWNDLLEVLDLSEGSILQRMGVGSMTEWTEESEQALRSAVEKGELPDIPVRLGDSVREWTDRCHLLIDPDGVENGRLFSLEGGLFRNVFLLTDFLSESWDHSVVNGIRMDRGCMDGLCIGRTDRNVWRMALGEPDYTLSYDADKAEANRTVMGECDYYVMGDNRLLLLSDEDGILQSISVMD